MRRLRVHEKPAVYALVAIALGFAALGVVYLTVTAPHLPSFVPGHVTRHVRHENYYYKRAAASFVVAVVLLVIAWSDSNLRRLRRHRIEEARLRNSRNRVVA